MIKTVIFDIGNVLMKFDYLNYIHNLLKDEEVIDKVNNAVWRTGNWERLDYGEDPDQVINSMLEAEPEYKEAVRLAVDRVGECMHRQDYAIPWIKKIKERGYQTLYLSNYSEFAMKVKPEVLDFLPLLDGGIFSCYVHMVKPDPAIYQKICDVYKLDPGQCVFIDDNENNIEAAKTFGMNAIQFKGYPETAEELDRLLEC